VANNPQDLDLDCFVKILSSFVKGAMFVKKNFVTSVAAAYLTTALKINI